MEDRSIGFCSVSNFDLRDGGDRRFPDPHDSLDLRRLAEHIGEDNNLGSKRIREIK
jgi:hypothetical protein